MILLQSPYSSPTKGLSLKDPEVGDNLTLNTQTRFYKAMSGVNYGYKKTKAVNKLNLKFINVNTRKGFEAQNFIKQSAGNEIKYVDKDSYVWRGFITDTVFNTVTNGLGQGGVINERHEAKSFTMVFEGRLTLVPLHNPDGSLVFDDSGHIIYGEVD